MVGANADARSFWPRKPPAVVELLNERSLSNNDLESEFSGRVISAGYMNTPMAALGKLQAVDGIAALKRERERKCTTSIQPAWLMRTDLCSRLGHLQNGCEAMANSLFVLMPHEQTHGAFSILKQIGILSPDGTKARAVKNVTRLIANSPSVAKVAPTEMAREARPNKPALLNRQRI